MAIFDLTEMVERGVHFGCRTSRWNPKMKSVIHSKRDRIYIIDLRKTAEGLIRAYKFLEKLAMQRKSILFVGTKRQAVDPIRTEAQRCGAHFVTSRWLGGTLTNMQTMRQRIHRLEQLDELIDSGSIHEYSKKMVASLTREQRKIFRNFEGTREMPGVPSAMVVVDPRNEHIAVAEALKLGVPLIAIADTDCDPDPIDFLIPGNDDSAQSIQYILSKLADAIISGRETGSRGTIIEQGPKTVGPEVAAATATPEIPSPEQSTPAAESSASE